VKTYRDIMIQVEIKRGKEVIILIMKNRRRTSPMFLWK